MKTDNFTLLNQAVLECLNNTDETSTIKAFTELGIKILGADFGFVWLSSIQNGKLKLVYKSPTLPYQPKPPSKKGRNFKVINSFIPDYVRDVSKTSDANYVSSYMKSFVIIPISYRNNIYGNIVFCFKKPESFSREKKILCTLIGSNIAQVLTIRRLLRREQKARLNAEKSAKIIRQSEEKFKLIASNTPDHILIQDVDFRYVMVINPQLGLTEKQMLGKTDFDLLTKKDAENLHAIKKKVIKTGKARKVGIPIINFKGEREYFDGSYIPRYDTDGKVNGLIGYFRNVTERKKYENKILEERAERQLILDSVPAMIFYKDTNNRFLMTNKVFQETMNLSKDDLDGVSLYDIYPQSQADAYWADDKEVITSGMPKLGIVEQMQTKNSVRWVETNKIPYRDERGQITGIIGFAVDITQRKEAEAISERERILEQEKVKTEFVADAAHELRTPLAIIKGNVDLALRKGPKLLDEREALQAIDEEIKHLSDILSALTLLTTKGARFQKKIVSKKVQIPALMRKVVARCRTLAYRKNIIIYLGNIPKVSISGDEAYLEKLFTNIIKNAITYGRDKGKVSVTGSKRRRSVEIVIADNGVGISSIDLPHIFERFFRADRARTSSEGRTGLGLAIVKWIAEAHGGTVSVSSNLGKGSTFTVSLPRKISDNII